MLASYNNNPNFQIITAEGVTNVVDLKDSQLSALGVNITEVLNRLRILNNKDSNVELESSGMHRSPVVQNTSALVGM